MTQSPEERIPIFVLTGFLGSGKTSLLNGILKNSAFADSAIIVNEFGEIGLDHLLVSTAKENTVLLDSGCLCCALVDSLKETLIDLYHRRARRDLPPFRRVFIETTGLADPGAILLQLTRDPLTSHFYRLRGVLCTVDSLLGEDQLGRHPEAVSQVAFADWLILTKTDLVGDSWPSSLTRVLRGINASAPMHRGIRGVLDSKALHGDASETAPWLDDIRLEARSEAEHKHDISSQSFWLAEAVTWSGIAAWTEWTRRQAGPGLLRCKAILNVAGVKAPVVLHGVRDRFEFTRLAAWPDEERRSRLVVIGRNLDAERQRAGIGWFHVEEGTMPPGSDDVPPAPTVAAERRHAV